MKAAVYNRLQGVCLSGPGRDHQDNLMAGLARHTGALRHGKDSNETAQMPFGFTVERDSVLQPAVRFEMQIPAQGSRACPMRATASGCS